MSRDSLRGFAHLGLLATLLQSFLKGRAGRSLIRPTADPLIADTEQPMDVRVTLKPGQEGTIRLATQYDDRLVCVRYRYHKVKRKRYTTIELIVG